MKHGLVVDDNNTNRKLASVMLKKCGWLADEAAGGSEALAMLSVEAYDFVLLDISMPGMSGEEVCRLIRANPALSGIHVVAYTAHALESEKLRIMSAGFNDIVLKPMSLGDLAAKLPK